MFPSVPGLSVPYYDIGDHRTSFHTLQRALNQLPLQALRALDRDPGPWSDYQNSLASIPCFGSISSRSHCSRSHVSILPSRGLHNLLLSPLFGLWITASQHEIVSISFYTPCVSGQKPLYISPCSGILSTPSQCSRA